MKFFQQHMEWILSCILYLATVLLGLSLLGIEQHLMIICGIGILWIVAKWIIQRSYVVEVITLLLLVSVLLIGWSNVMQATSQLMHRVLEKLAIEQQIIVPSVTKTLEGAQEVWFALILGFISIIIAMLSGALVKMAKSKWLVLFLMFVLLGQFISGWMAPLTYNVLFLFAILLPVLYQRHTFHMFVKRGMITVGILLMGLSISIYSGIMDRYEPPQSVALFQQYVKTWLSSTRFEKSS